MLARLPEDHARDIIERSDRRPFTPHTLTDINAIMDKVAQTRANGFSLAISQILAGEIAVGFAVLDHDGLPVGAIHVAGSLAEWTPEDYIARIAPLGQQAARALSKY